MSMRRYFYRRPGSVDHGKRADLFLTDALNACRLAEEHLKVSGHKRAAWGVHQAAMRLLGWQEKVREAIVREDT